MAKIRVKEYKNSNFIFEFEDDRLLKEPILFKSQLNDKGEMTDKITIISNLASQKVDPKVAIFDIVDNMSEFEDTSKFNSGKGEEVLGNVFHVYWKYVSPSKLFKDMESADITYAEVDFNGLKVRFSRSNGRLKCTTSSRLWMKSPITSFVFNTVNKHLEKI